MLETRIAGIPCQIQVGRCFVQKAMGQRADSDLDCYGYSEVEYTVCDRNGRPAPWLSKKMTAEDDERIINEILESKE